MSEVHRNFIRSSEYYFTRARSWVTNQRDRLLNPTAWAFVETMNEGRYRPSAHIDVLPGHRLIYVNVPKCASTTIKTILSSLEGRPIAREHVHQRRHSGLKSPTMIGVSRFHRIATCPGAFKFSFVRNPYARIVSAWADKYRDKPLVPGDSFVEKYLAHRAAVSSKLPYGADETLSFEEFVEFATATAHQRLDAHWGLQDDLLSMPGIELDFVGKTENFLADLAYVLNRVAPGFDVQKPVRQRLNATRHQAWPKYYTPALAKRVYGTYERDFDRFAYPRALQVGLVPRNAKPSVGGVKHSQPAGNALD